MRLLTYRGVPVWRDVRVLRWVAQIISVIVVLSFLFFAVSNVLDAADKRGLALGFDFLEEEAGFPIAESVIDYEESDFFRYAFLMGILNTIKVALLGIVLATVLGFFLGVARLSTNWLLRQIAGVYIEIFRNIPLLVQLFFWYFGVFLLLPTVRDSIHWPGPVYLSNRGIFMVWGHFSGSFAPWLLFVLAGFALAVLARVVLSRRQERSGRPRYPNLAGGMVLVLVAAVGWVLMPESPLSREVPAFDRFNFKGSLRLTPEFLALLVGLVVYTSAFIAEVVRAGIQSVQRGQVEASRALGLSGMQSLRFVIIPQALRVIIPPLISQFLNLTKNSSLAIAIGYPDLFSIGRIMINQAGRAVPIFLMIMAAYLAMSLTYAIVGNIYNRLVRYEER
ncbi:MAG: ABC transporter permease subunit [Dehalococcoidia bacterium]|nr:ABC transporter permease subunit [Dehalococcoidia bacterium]